MTTTSDITTGTPAQTAPAVRAGLRGKQRANNGGKHHPVINGWTVETNWIESIKNLPRIHSLEMNRWLEMDGWSRKMSATLAYLKHAQDMLNAAETKIARQQERIALLENLATTDDLTGIKNSRGFYEAFLRELDCADRGISKGGLLVMIDLDNFKSINDTYGHPAGDAVLKLVAKTIGAEIRRMDIAARLGGDEFVLLLGNTTADDATPRAQKISWQLNNLSLAWNGHIIPVHASAGLKTFTGGDRAENILNSADGTLYAVKAERKTLKHSEAKTA